MFISSLTGFIPKNLKHLEFLYILSFYFAIKMTNYDISHLSQSITIDFDKLIID